MIITQKIGGGYVEDGNGDDGGLGGDDDHFSLSFS